MLNKYRIHVVGSGPRTGTTLLTEVIRTCFEIDAACEHEATIMQSNSSFGNFKVLLTKHPSEISAVQLPLFFDPNLYVICIIRDPRDMISSFHGAYPDEYWCSLRYWSVFTNYFKHLRKHKRFIVIKYEEFTNNPNKVQKYLESKIPFIKTKCNFSDYHLYSTPSESSKKALKSFRPIESKGIGNWKSHLPRVKQQIKIHGDISDSLIQFGYELNKKWLRELDGVIEGNYITKTPEFFSKDDLKKRSQKGYIAALKIIIDRMGLNSEKVLNPIKKMVNKFRT